MLDAVQRLANHPNANEVYMEVVKAHPSISKGTVYRNLNVLADNATLLRLPVPGADRYDHNTFAHYHITCDVCGSFKDFDPSIVQVDESALTKLGFTLNPTKTIFIGTCHECSNKK